MKRIKLIVGITILSLTIASCKKEGCMDPVATNYSEKAKKDDGSCVYPEAQLSISEPTTNKVYHLGDVVHIQGSASHYEQLHGWSLYILNKTTGDTVYTAEDHAHATTIEIHSSWVNNVSVDSDMELSVTVIVDHDGAVITDKVNFHCKSI